MGEETYPFIAASGHYGPKSPCLIKHYVEDLGLRYLSASSKEEFECVLPEFMKRGQSVVLEAFTDNEGENAAFKLLRNLIPAESSITSTIKSAVLNHISEENVSRLKKILKK